MTKMFIGVIIPKITNPPIKTLAGLDGFMRSCHLLIKSCVIIILCYNQNMNKRFFETSSTRKEDRDFWKKKTYLQKIQALEKLRRIIFGYDPSAARLQRTFRITQLKED